MRLLWAELVAVRAELVSLQIRVQELEARLGQNSSNSSRPLALPRLRHEDLCGAAARPAGGRLWPAPASNGGGAKRRYRPSRREGADISTDVLGAPVAVGSVDGLCQATAQALATLVAVMAPIQEECHALLEQGQRSGHYKAIGLGESLLKLEPALWTFITVAGVEPTNNAAEQALRPAVLWRKGSFGTQSADGNTFVTRLLSVAATCKQQQRSLLEYLTAVCTAAQRAQPIPSLVPVTPLADVA